MLLAAATALGAVASVTLGLAGAAPWYLAVAVAGLCPVALIPATVRRAGRGDGTPLLATGVLLTALSAAGAGIAATVAPHALAGDVPLPVELPLVALFFVVGADVLGLWAPGLAPAPLPRARAWLDGGMVAVNAIYTVWLLVMARVGPRGAAVTATLLGGLALGAAIAGAMHGTGPRRRTLRSGLGAALSVAGLTALVLALDYQGPRLVVAVAVLALTAAAALIWSGAAAGADGPAPPRLDVVGTSGHPLLALPLIASALATGYQLVQRRGLDPVAIGLAMVSIVVVVAREVAGTLTLRRYAAHLAEQGDRLRALVFDAGEVALLLDEALTVRWQSPAAARQFGLSDQDVVGQPATALVHPKDADRCVAHLTGATESTAEFRLRDGFGVWRETEWRLSGPDPGRPGWSLVVHVRDVSQRRELERTLRLARYTDALTSLANREGLFRAADPRPTSGALIVIDLHGLTGVRDLHGTELGETVLLEAARRLRGGVAEPDMPARIGERCFAVLTRHGAVRAHLLASRLLNLLTAPYAAPGTRAHLSASAGLADLSADVEVDEVLRRAELALRATRQSGRTGSVEWYDEAMEARLLRRSALEQELPAAVGLGQLDLAYQPIVELCTDRPVGVEALLRWRHPTLGTVPPTELVPVADELGVLDEIRAWVLHRACRQLSAWMREGRELFVAVNVTAHELATPHFVPGVSAALETHLVPPSALVVEVAEPLLVAAREDPVGRSRFDAVLDHLAELRALGVRTAVDNFGIGPTSLRQLRVLPLDLLKIDRLVFAPEGQGQAGAIIDVMVRLGAQFGISVLAQGLETAGDLDVAKAAGCRFGQGYLMSRPVPPEHLEAYLDEHRGSLA